MGYVSSNMINLNGPLTGIFCGFLLAITGCVILIESPDLSNAAYALFLVAGLLMALSAVTLAGE
jgi:fucose permease